MNSVDGYHHTYVSGLCTSTLFVLINYDREVKIRLLFLVFYLTLGFLCIRHNYFSVNIILEIANFRFYTCMVENEDGQKREQRILSHRRLNGCIGDTLYLKSLNNEYTDVQQ